MEVHLHKETLLLYVWGQTAIILLHGIKMLVFLINAESDYCEVRTDIVWIICPEFMLHVSFIPQQTLKWHTKATTGYSLLM